MEAQLTELVNSILPMAGTIADDLMPALAFAGGFVLVAALVSMFLDLLTR